MGREIRFGGKAATPPGETRRDDTLAPLLEQLSWKYVKADADFHSGNSQKPLKGKMGHWAGRVWFHQKEMPTGAALRAFDIMSLEAEYHQYITLHGEELFDVGMTVEEILASSQLYHATPMVAVISKRFSDLVAPRMEPVQLQNSQSMVWLLAAMCLQCPQLTEGQGFNLLVSDGETGHTIYLKGLNGIDFEHPRGPRVRPGWISFHDPWPARSLLAPERNFDSVQVLEDVTCPPMWLISPEDLDKVLVGYLFPIDGLPALFDLFRTLDFVEKVHSGKDSPPLWLDESAPDPLQPFSILLAMHGNVTPTTAEGQMGLGRVRLLSGDVQGALECFEHAITLGLPEARRRATELLASSGL